jgi:molybdenum cofactor sulfurtransferase
MNTLQEAERLFSSAYPAYAATGLLDELRASDYERLDRLGHVYMDYTGGGIYAASQIRAHSEFLLSNVYGNPHSTNPTSALTTQLVEQARTRVLEFFNASPQEYAVVFTPNATGALKLVGESYPFAPGSRFLLPFDNHNSVNGIREFARSAGATVVYTPVVPPDMRCDESALAAHLEQADPAVGNLFAYPAQSNFSGVQHSLEWIARARSRGWHVLLDAAAYIPTNRLDLASCQPDFVSLSFYKLFGYPTGVGCLIARKAALAKLRRPWFSGGTITVASVQGDRHYMHEGPEAFEDGTINYLALPAVEIGLRHVSRIGYETIHTRVACLTGWLLNQLAALSHQNGSPVVRIYGPVAADARGGTVACNFYSCDGHFIDHRIIEDRANRAYISLRTGCFCNPGGGEAALGISAQELSACFTRTPERLSLDDFRRCIDDKSTGAVRLSLGLVSNFADVYQFMRFARRFADKRADEI